MRGAWRLRNACSRYNYGVKRARILGIVFLGIVCLAAVGVAMYSEAVRIAVTSMRDRLWATRVAEGDYPDKWMTPSNELVRWKMGDVIGYAEKPDDEVKVRFSFSTIDESSFLLVTPAADNSENTKIFYYGSSPESERDSILDETRLELSEERLSDKLPGPPGDTIGGINHIAQEARHVMFWPRELWPVKRAINNLALGKLLIEYKHPIAIHSSSYEASGDKEVLELPGLCSLWKDLCFFESYSSTWIELRPGNNTIHSDDSAVAKEAWNDAGNSLLCEILLARIFPEGTGKTGEYCGRAYEWWSTGSWTLVAKSEGYLDESSASHWESSGGDTSSSSSDLPESWMIEPTEINGVHISGFSTAVSSGMKLKLGDKTILRDQDLSGGRLWTPSSHTNSAKVKLSLDKDYPVFTADISSAQVKDDIALMRAFAKRLLSVPASHWPRTEWSKLLWEDMDALRDGRYEVSYLNNDDCGLYIHHLYEGSKASLVAYAAFHKSFANSGVRIEMMVDAGGFTIYDPVGACTLDVGNGVKFTQQASSFRRGDKLNLTAAKALAEAIQTDKEDLTPELLASLQKALEFLSNPKLPAPELGEVMPPEWSYTVEFKSQNTLERGI